MDNAAQSIPRPLVRTNQWVIVLSVIFTWLTGFYWFLAIPLAAGLLGLLIGFNPVMRLAKLFLRKKPSEYLQEDKGQQNFNQTLAVSFLLLALIGYVLQWHAFAYIFSAMVCIAAFVAILGFCVGCFIHFQWSQYRHRRNKRRV
ncbi:DUF4395 domain-containing protein [Paenibacillus terreus]|uniref:DUF4395 domain-containing protein n=1 Tax=Paenibacillus terreus TaxID=1387834 RepID=A0ABV5B945_9BACL